jgi:AcrR family transcriptional regulator
MQIQSTQLKVTTRDRILDAAIRRFSRQSYEATGLRDIAADVGIDVAYVHRSFGSKERLFAAAVEASIQPERFLAGSPRDLAATLARQVLARDIVQGSDEIGPLDIVIHSLSSPEASRVLREVIVNDFINPLAGKLDSRTASPAAMIAALLVGVGILRSVLGVAPLLEADRVFLERMLTDAIETVMKADTVRQAPAAVDLGTA